jgi:hypothetical protein
MLPRALASALLVVAALSAGAAEFEPGWSSEAVWDSNVLGTSDSTTVPVRDPVTGAVTSTRTQHNDVKSDFLFRTGPVLRIREPKGSLRYFLEYNPRYDAYAPLNGITGINEFEHFARGQGTWQISPLTDISFNDYLAKTSSLSQLAESVPPGQTPLFVLGRQSVLRNQGQVSLTHRLSRRWQLSVDFNNTLYEYQNPLQPDTTAWSGSTQIMRSLTRRLLVGLGGTGQRQVFQGINGTPNRGTTIFQGFGVVEYRISPTWSIRANLGPAYVMPDSVSAPNSFVVPVLLGVNANQLVPYATTVAAQQLPPPLLDSMGQPLHCTSDQYSPFFPTLVFRCSSGVLYGPSAISLSGPRFERVPFQGNTGAQPSLTYYGRISMSKTWRLWRGELELDRSASNSSGIGTTTNLTVFTASLRYTPSEMWDATVTGSYSVRTAASDEPVLVYQLDPFRVAFSGGQVLPGTSCQTASCVQADYAIPTGVTTTTVGNSATSKIYNIGLTAQRHLTKRLRLSTNVSYWRQQSSAKNALESGVDLERQVNIFRVSIGVTYDFEPIPLPL